MSDEEYLIEKELRDYYAKRRAAEIVDDEDVDYLTAKLRAEKEWDDDYAR